MGGSRCFRKSEGAPARDGYIARRRLRRLILFHEPSARSPRFDTCPGRAAFGRARFLPGPALAKRGPIIHEVPSLLEKVAAPIGGLNRVADSVGKGLARTQSPRRPSLGTCYESHGPSHRFAASAAARPAWPYCQGRLECMPSHAVGLHERDFIRATGMTRCQSRGPSQTNAHRRLRPCASGKIVNSSARAATPFAHAQLTRSRPRARRPEGETPAVSIRIRINDVLCS